MIIAGPSTDVNRNDKLQIFDGSGEEFRIDITQVSDDLDVEKNYAPITTNIDGTISPVRD